MRFLTLYLAFYFLLLGAATFVLWTSGILERIPGVWMLAGVLVAIGFGVLLAVASGRHAATPE